MHCVFFFLVAPSGGLVKVKKIFIALVEVGKG